MNIQTLVKGLSTALAVTLGATGSQAGEGSPALWHVKDQDTTLYILGAAEITADDAWFAGQVKEAFDASNMVVLETDDSPQSQAQVAQVVQTLGVYRDGSTLESRLNEDQKQLVGSVASSLGAPLQALNPLKPWLASVQLGSLNAARQGYQAWTSSLTVLRERATADGKTVHYLEPSRAALLKTLSALPEETHMKMLTSSAQQLRDMPKQAESVAAAWQAGDIDTLTELYHGEGQWADDMMYDAILVERNKAWVRKIEDILSSHDGTVFLAIGAGHVLGQDSLLKMLASKGHKVEK